MAEKVSYPEPVVEAINKYIFILDEEKFFTDEIEFPPNMEEVAKTHFSNLMGEALMPKFIKGGSDYSTTVDEMTKVLNGTILQTNLDSLMADKLIDGVEDENGETLYWITDKGIEEAKKMNGDVDNS